MKLRFLGTGTSFGVPVIGCRCDVCRSSDPRNRRTRHALLLSEGPRRLLVDLPPELRLQLLAAAVDRLDAVFLSHPHADHLHGIDDLRAIAGQGDPPLPFHVAEEHAAEIRSRFPYFLGPELSIQPGTVVPGLAVETFRDRQEVEAAGFRLRVLGMPHGAFRSYGFRTGPLGVIIDGKSVPEDAWDALTGLRVLVINALWRGESHPTHFNVDEALDVIRRLAPRRAFLTHLTHRVDHAALSASLPDGVEVAFDGLEISV